MTHVLYHGSPKEFDEFTNQKQSSHGRAQGFGIYLTKSKQLAFGYSGPIDGPGFVYEVDATKIEEMKHLDNKKITLTVTDVVSLLESITEEEEYPYTLTDYYCDNLEPGWTPKNQEIAKEVARHLLDQEDNDLDIINDLNNVSGETDALAKGLTKLGIGSTKDDMSMDENEEPAIVVFDPKNVSIIRKMTAAEAKKELDMNDNQKSVQRQEILQEGALEVGYSNDVKAAMLDLDPDLLGKTFSDEGLVLSLSQEAQKDLNNQPNQFDNLLVTEMVRNLEPDDFGDVSGFFFNDTKDHINQFNKSFSPTKVDLSQSTYKRLKQEIVDESALNIGYSDDIKSDMLYLDPDLLKRVMVNENITQGLSSEAEKLEQGLTNQFDNILVTEMTKELNYQDFKAVAPKFMNFAKAERNQQEDLDFAVSQIDNEINF